VIGDILQPTHLLFVLVIALLVLGPKRLPEVGRALGNGLRDFKSAINGEDDHHEQITDAPGFESDRSEAMSDESHDGAPASEHAPSPVASDPAPAPVASEHAPSPVASEHAPSPVASEHEPAPSDQSAADNSHDVPPVTSPAEPAPPAHPEDVSAATAAQPSSSVASEPATERTERLG
jgi:sec-independent protein translocase protein TatA